MRVDLPTRQRARGASIFPVLALVAASALTWWACRAPGLNNGAACVRATECESLVCNFQLAQDASADGSATGTCVGRCTSSAQCANSFVCGRYDFRGIIPDSGPDGEGVREGPDFEILRSCRPKLNVACSRDEQCGRGEGCFGAPSGVCARRCSRSSECVTRFCVSENNSESCGSPGLCMPECDDLSECAANQYCAFAYGGNSVHGRCAPLMTADGGCPGPDADADAGDASASDADASVPDAPEPAPDADAAAADGDGAQG
ncbi:MAG: hypothetical protein JNK05_17380 [Myxococcales bacterium]|nr:hypothetical protein [Myxococcales bacterium]